MISYIMDASMLMRQSKELNLTPKLFVGGAAGFTLPEFQKNAGSATEYVYSATLWTPSVPYPGAKEYYDKFFAKYNEPTEYHGAEAYAALYVIADALKRAKNLTRQDVRDALAKTDMMTAFGPVKFISYDKKIITLMLSAGLRASFLELAYFMFHLAFVFTIVWQCAQLKMKTL